MVQFAFFRLLKRISNFSRSLINILWILVYFAEFYFAMPIFFFFLLVAFYKTRVSPLHVYCSVFMCKSCSFFSSVYCHFSQLSSLVSSVLGNCSLHCSVLHLCIIVVHLIFVCCLFVWLWAIELKSLHVGLWIFLSQRHKLRRANGA